VLGQKLSVLLSKGFLPMMLLLISDILRTASTADSLTDSAILILPFKFVWREFLVIHPMRGFPFQQLRDLCDRLICFQSNQGVDMIRNAVDRIKVNAFLPRIFPNMSEKFGSDFFAYQRLSILGRPDQMDPHSKIRHLSS